MNKEVKEMELQLNLNKNIVCNQELLSGFEESHLKIMKITSDIINSEIVQLEQETFKNNVEAKVSKPKKRQSQLKKTKAISFCNDSGICMDDENQCKKKKNTKSTSRKSLNKCNDSEVCMDQEIQSKKIENSRCVSRKSESACNDNSVCIGKKGRPPKKNTNARSASQKITKPVGACDNDAVFMNEVTPKKRKNTKSISRKSEDLCYDSGILCMDQEVKCKKGKNVKEDSRKSVDVCKSAGVCMDEEVQSKKKKTAKSVSSENNEIPDNKTKTRRKLYTSGDKLTASKQVLVEVKMKINYRTSKGKKDNSEKIKLQKDS